MFFIFSFKCFDLKNVLAISPILFPDSISPSLWTWRLLAQRPLHTIKASYAFIPSKLTAMMASHLSAPLNFEHASGKVGNIYAPENTSNTIIFSGLSTCCLWPPRKQSMNCRGGCECFPVLADLPPSCEMEMIRWQDLSPCQQKVVKTSGTGTWMAAQSTFRGSQDESFPGPAPQGAWHSAPTLLNQCCTDLISGFQTLSYTIWDVLPRNHGEGWCVSKNSSIPSSTLNSPIFCFLIDFVC